jgi:L-histidine Nalpha-methyltransferase
MELDMTSAEISYCHDNGSRDRFARDVVNGLARSPRVIPCKYFYDFQGSRLFDQITEQPAYYLTLAETELLEAHAPAISALLGPQVDLIELGSGSSIKTRLLLNALRSPLRYLPIDISAEHLTDSAHKLRHEYPDLRVEPVEGDYSASIEGVSNLPNAKRAVFFAGSSIGNFEPDDAVAFLARAKALAGVGGVVLIGADLPKQRDVLERAYDDPAGVTAAFNLNLLSRMVRELGASIEIDHFRHEALWQPGLSRVGMHLVAQQDTHITVDETRFDFVRGDFIVTEHCYKYSVEAFGAIAQRAGLYLRHSWHDPSVRVSMYWLDGCDEIDGGQQLKVAMHSEMAAI